MNKAGVSGQEQHNCALLHCSLRTVCCFEFNNLGYKTADIVAACRPSVGLSGWQEKDLKAKMEEGFYIFFPFRILQVAGELHDAAEHAGS